MSARFSSGEGRTADFTEKKPFSKKPKKKRKKLKKVLTKAKKSSIIFGLSRREGKKKPEKAEKNKKINFFLKKA